jgi:gliding motility-associated-like protein
MFIMRATGTNGCIDFDTMFVYVTYEPIDSSTLLQNVQNVITPNGDGRNDMLDISEIVGNDGCLISILDRWGREVFRQDNYANTWSGTTTAGEELPDGTYYYIVKCGDDIRYKGPVTILKNQN